MAAFGEEENTLSLPTSLANQIAAVARADIQSEGDSPPPSRPAPQPISSKRRRPYKSTENVTRLLTGNGADFLDPDMDRPSPGASSPPVQALPESPKKPSRRAAERDKESKSGWGEGMFSIAAVNKAGDLDIDDEIGDASKPVNTNGRTAVEVIVPDLQDVEEDQMITTIAAPPLVKVGRVKTIRELDNDLANGPGSIIDNTNVMGVDLSILSNSALCLPEHVMEEDRPWDWDILFTQISSELASEDKSYEVFSPLDDLAAARKTGILPLGKVPKAAAGERRPTVKDLAGGKVKGPIQRPTEV